MPREKQRNSVLTRRAALLAGGQALLGAAIVGRMYQLQVLQKDRYAVLADENRINLRLLVPPRGRVYDRFGVPLADNKHNYRVVVIPEQTGDLEAALAAIGKLIDVTEADRNRVLREVRRKHSFVPLVVRSNLSWEEMARIEVAIPELPGVAIEQGMIRHYPYGPIAPHILGYVAAVSEQELTGDPLLELPDFRIGKSGIEKSQDRVLRGAAGTSQIEVNAHGRVVREIAASPGQPGQDLVLGIDMAMQDFVTRRCAAEPSVSCVLLDAVTGDVLALVSSPGFDPTAFSTGLTPAMWQELSTDPRNPLTDKAIGGAYPPGSTFKPVVALAALESGSITPETAVSCPGYLELGDATFHCWKKGGHGTVRLRDAIKKSCDVYFYETARRTGIDRIAEMAKRIGLAAPLQLATRVARLVTGRAVVPHLLRPGGRLVPGGDAGPPAFAQLGVSPRSLGLVLDGMAAVVNEQGGDAYAARVSEPALAMGGKSGTSQVRRITQHERDHGLRKVSEIPWKERDHALFVAFAPIGAPRSVCSVVVEHGGETGGGGSAVGAPICRDVLVEAQRRDPARKVPQAGPVAQTISPDLPVPMPAAAASPGFRRG